jgi:hypothetical protein
MDAEMVLDNMDIIRDVREFDNPALHATLGRLSQAPPQHVSFQPDRSGACQIHYQVQHP